MGNCLLNSLRLSINRRGGSSPLRFVERQDEGRARGCAPVPGQGIGAALRCLFTHPPGATNSTLPKNLHNSQGFKDIHGNLYVWRYIWEYVCVEERASEAPPAVVRRICGYVGLYVWWRERESEREGEGRGGRGWGETTTTLRQNHSTSTTQLAAWLAAMALSDKTASPTDNRCAAILYFHKIAGGVTPDDMEIVRMTKESIRRKLGYKNQSKKPLLQEQVDEVVGQFLSQPTIQGLANAFRVALAYEATLRWDDYEDMTFGDFIVTHDFVRVFLVDTKTDSTRSGQWATFAASTRSKSAYQLYRSLLSKLSSELSPEQIAQWPVMFRGEQGSLTGNESKMRYQEFLKNLKEVCRLLGYDEDMLGTHSLRRGSVTDQFRFGIPDQVIKTSGRWKSAAFQRYIDQETILSFHLRAIQTMEAAREKI